MALLVGLARNPQMSINRQLTFTVSVVSHNHSDMVRSMIDTLVASGCQSVSRAVITSNVPSLDNFVMEPVNGSCFDVMHINNADVRGFGANHNQAFKLCDTDFFCVINPDIEFTSDPFPRLIDALSTFGAGLAYPSQVDGRDDLLDFQRELVSPAAIAYRYLSGKRYKIKSNSAVHWVSGAFMVFRSSVFRELGGFDERYFMYCEDVDICLRMQLAGYSLVHARANVIHHTSRNTLKKFRHLIWHARSLLRLWLSVSYSEYKTKFIYRRNRTT